MQVYNQNPRVKSEAGASHHLSCKKMNVWICVHLQHIYIYIDEFRAVKGMEDSIGEEDYPPEICEYK